MVNATPRPLYRRERDLVLFVQEVWWTPGPVWTGTENLALTGIRSPDRPIAMTSSAFLNTLKMGVEFGTINQYPGYIKTGKLGLGKKNMLANIHS